MAFRCCLAVAGFAFIKRHYPSFCMRKILGTFVLCIIPLCVSAQLDLNALKSQSDAKARERKQESSDFQSGRNVKWGEFMAQRGEEWAKTIANRDAEWSDFLSDSEWTLFEGFLTDKRPEKPKPVTVPKIGTEPVSKPKPQPVVLPKEAVVKPAPKPDVKPQPEPLPCKPAETKPEGNKGIGTFVFYGRRISVSADPKLKSYNGSRFGQKEIADFWKVMSATDYTPTVTSLMDEKDAMGLNDWGYYLMVSKFSKTLYSDDDRSMLLTWFLLVRSGLDVRVGYNDGGVVLLLPTMTSIYDMSYVVMEGNKYYVINNSKGGGVKTCPGSYSDGRPLDFTQSKPLLLGGRSAVRRLSFKFKGVEYSMDFNYDPDVIEYYKALPQAQFEVFFGASPSEPLKQSIVNNLKPIVANMDKPTAMNFLLQFVQLSFDYKTDPQQFGYEKYFYADELFFYPYCDCEDRSVLFSYLAHTLMGYDVVGTEFPEHMATAVALDYQTEGVKYRVGTQTYTVADPTFINATVGQCMSKYESKTPIIHQIDFAE